MEFLLGPAGRRTAILPQPAALPFREEALKRGDGSLVKGIFGIYITLLPRNFPPRDPTARSAEKINAPRPLPGASNAGGLVSLSIRRETRLIVPR